MTQLNPSPYSVRPATPDDIDALVHHRISMFIEMGLSLDVPAVGLALRAWLAEKIPAETYRAWVVEADRTVVAGAGMAILPWPPGPQWLGGRIGFVSSVYTEPAHRSRGLARSLMEAIHDWCRSHDIGVVGLTATDAGQPLYESMGYHAAAAPTMWTAVD